MKLGPVTKLGKRNKTLKKMTSCHQIVTSLSFFPFILNLQQPWSWSGRTVCKTYISITNNLLSYKIWKQKWKISNTTLTLSLWVKELFFPEMLIFCKIMLTSTKLRSWYWNVLKGIFSGTSFVCVVRFYYIKF